MCADINYFKSDDIVMKNIPPKQFAQSHVQY